MILNQALWRAGENAGGYVSLRSIYLQRRRSEVAGKYAGAKALPDIFDIN